MEKYGRDRHVTDGIIRHRKDANFMLDNHCKIYILFLVIVTKSSTKYFVDQQQYLGNPLLHFHGNTEHLFLFLSLHRAF